MKRIARIKRPLEYYVEKLDRKESWSFARWGDAEILTLLGYIGKRNSNGCTFTQYLCDCLRQVLQSNHLYIHALSGIANRKLGAELWTFCQRVGIEVSWANADLFLNKSLKGLFGPMIKAMRPYTILYVGPEYCKNLNTIGLIDYIDFIVLPRRDAITQRKQIIRAVKQSIVKNKINLIIWSAGLHTIVFLDDIWTYTNGNITQIDVGSMFDGYFGILSRSYIRKGIFNFDELLRQNLGV